MKSQNRRRKINQFISHGGTHFDEYLGEVLCLDYGQEVFDISDDLKYGYIQSIVPNDFHLNFPETLFFGVAGGELDDHGKEDQKACCLLVAEYLGIEDRPEIINLLQVVGFRDKELAQNKNPFTITRVINMMHRYGVGEPDPARSSEIVMEWAYKIIRAIIQSERELLENVKSEFMLTPPGEQRRRLVRKRFLSIHRPWIHLTVKACSTLLGKEGESWLKMAQDAQDRQQASFDRALTVASSHIEEFKTSFGKVRTLMIDGSDGRYNDCEIEFDAVSRNLKIDVVLLKSSKENIFVGVNPSFAGNLEGFVRVLRMNEAELRGVMLTPEQLIAQGTLQELCQWHVHEMKKPEQRYRRIYNGTNQSRSMVEPSALTFEQIQDILLTWLNVEKRLAQAG